MKARIRHRVRNHGISAEDRARGHTDPLVVAEVTVTFSRAIDADHFAGLIVDRLPNVQMERDLDRAVRFNCDPGKGQLLAQMLATVVSQLRAIALAEDAIDSLIKGRDGIAKLAW